MDRRLERGNVMVIAALAMTALILFGALAVDVGVVWSSRTQSQNADDAAALAAAAKMISQVGTAPATVELATARAKGKEIASENATVGEAVSTGGVTVNDEHFSFGNWDLQTRTLDTGVDLTDPDEVTGVRVDVRMDGVVNDRSPTFLSGLLGKTGFEVNNTAVAYLGFEGSFGAGEFDLPIAVDSCDLTTDPSGCGDDFCSVSENPIDAGPCSLAVAQDDADDIICLEFSNTGDQDGCWTAFDGEDPNINKNKLTDIVDDGNAGDVDAGDPVYLDNGDKTSTLDYIRDKFYGCDKFQGTPAGTDEYGPWPAPPKFKSDSWVVKLPVVECQRDDRCAGGDPVAIVGGVCFEVREIIVPTPGHHCTSQPAPPIAGDRLVKGRFLCPNSPDPKVRELFYEHCAGDDDDAPSGPGGCNFGFRADRVVLVE